MSLSIPLVNSVGGPTIKSSTYLALEAAPPLREPSARTARCLKRLLAAEAAATAAAAAAAAAAGASVATAANEAVVVVASPSDYAVWRPKQRPIASVTALEAAAATIVLEAAAGAVAATVAKTPRGVVPGGVTAVAPAMAVVEMATGVAQARRTAAREEGTAGIPGAIQAVSIRGEMLKAPPGAQPPTFRRETTLVHLPRTSRWYSLRK